MFKQKVLFYCMTKTNPVKNSKKGDKKLINWLASKGYLLWFQPNFPKRLMKSPSNSRHKNPHQLKQIQGCLTSRLLNQSAIQRKFWKLKKPSHLSRQRELTIFRKSSRAMVNPSHTLTWLWKDYPENRLLFPWMMTVRRIL